MPPPSLSHCHCLRPLHFAVAAVASVSLSESNTAVSLGTLARSQTVTEGKGDVAKLGQTDAGCQNGNVTPKYLKLTLT